MAFGNNCNNYNVTCKYRCSQPTFVIEGNAKLSRVWEKNGFFFPSKRLDPWIVRNPADFLFIFHENLNHKKSYAKNKLWTNMRGKWRSSFLVELVELVFNILICFFFFYVPLLPAGISIVLFNEPLMNSLTSMT